MINEREIQAMVRLLDDTDEEVVRMVEERMLSLGEEIVPLLEDQWGIEFNMARQLRIEKIIQRIHFETVCNALTSWVASDQQDLFEGICILTRYQFPALDVKDINNRIEKIRLDAWLEMHYDLTALEKVRILNHVFYEVNGFTGNTTNYHSPQNSYINTVLDQAKGNPISLAIIYSIVAQRLGIPIFGVNLPQHFVLAYVHGPNLEETGIAEKNLLLRSNELGKVMFYINPFNKGLVFTRQNIDEFARQLKMEPNENFYEPCSNVEILKRVVRNLVSSYLKMDRMDKVNDLTELMKVLGGTLEFTEPDEDEEA